MNHAIGARRLLRQCRTVALATHSRHLQGYPYASLAPIVLDRDVNPVLLISRLAEHTKNVEADERASIVAQHSANDVQAAPRLTLLGACRRADDREQLAARYLRYFPAAARLLELDFEFYRFKTVALRYIGGFGSVHWLAPEAITSPADGIESIEATLLEKVNTQQAQALRECCRRIHGIDATDICMIGLDCDGFDARAGETLLRFEFAEPVADADSVRAALAVLIQEGGG